MKTGTQLIGYHCGLGAANQNCQAGPATLFAAPEMQPITNHFDHVAHLNVDNGVAQLAAIPKIAAISQDLAEITAQCEFFVTLGGDHTSAIGSVSGARKANTGPLGLIWIDAHLDSHTPDSSTSKNVHGMPLAALLGYGDPSLTQIATADAKVLPQHVCIIGVRDYEPEELALLESLKVRIITMDEIRERGLEACMNEAYQIAQHETTGFYISLDVDAIDPKDAPGTGAPVPDGIRADEIIQCLQHIQHFDQLVGVDITEFNPSLDIERKTEQMIIACLKAILSNPGKNTL